MNRGSIRFTKKQLEYLIKKTGAGEPDEAVEILVKLFMELDLDPFKMQDCVDLLMKKDGV